MIKHRVALITGGAGGLGKAIASRLAQADCDIALLDLDSEAGNEVANELSLAAPNSQVRFFRADVTSQVSVAEAMEKIDSAFSRLDILVNNAGITRATPLEFIEPAEWDLVMAINLRGPFLLLQQAIPRMREGQWGRIVNISSIAAIAGGGFVGTAHYAASKAGLIALTKAAAKAVAKDGITVNAVAPGPIRTRMSQSWIPAKESEVARSIPVGRIGEPADIASAVAYLASEEAGFINGHTLVADGGATIGSAKTAV